MATSRSQHPKITRKDLYAPDPLQEFIANARDFLVENIRQVIISAAVVAGSAGIAIGVYYYELNRDAQAGARFYAAMEKLQKKDYPGAEGAFRKLADDEPNRELGKLSRFYLATAYLEAGDWKKAQQELVTYLADAHDRNFSNLAMTDLAVVYENLGDYKKAQSAYAQAAAAGGPEQARDEIGVARMMLKQDDKQGAIRAYQNYLAAHPFSRDRQVVLEALADLGTQAKPPSSKPAAALR